MTEQKKIHSCTGYNRLMQQQYLSADNFAHPVISTFNHFVFTHEALNPSMLRYRNLGVLRCSAV